MGSAVAFRYWLALSVTLFGLLVIHIDTFVSIVTVWISNDNFTHGFVIFPISGYLIWRRRQVLARQELRSFPLAGILVVGVSLVWAVSEFLGIQVLTHAAVIAIIPMLVLLIAGTDVTRTIQFPLLYLVFAVPFGEAIIPPLMEITASFTVDALRITGIPVIREGRFFAIPAGNFEVARACAGLSYTLAALAMGALYGYTCFRSIRKRVLLLFFVFVVSIFANGLRAYLIVLLGHFSDMRIAVGMDHIFFGWLIFGVVLAAMFLVGIRFRDRTIALGEDVARTTNVKKGSTTTSPVSAASLAFVCILSGPGLVIAFESGAQEGPPVVVGLPGEFEGWKSKHPEEIQWRPSYSGWSSHVVAEYEAHGKRVRADVFHYNSYGQDSELANSENRLSGKDSDWVVRNLRQIDVELRHGSMTLVESLVSLAGERRLVWYWYTVDGKIATNAPHVKMLEAWRILSSQYGSSSAVILSTRASVDYQSTREILHDFLSSSYDHLRACLIRSADSVRCSIGQIEEGPE